MEPALRTILMPLGGLPGASEALDAAMKVAKRFEAQVEVLHVYRRASALCGGLESATDRGIRG